MGDLKFRTSIFPPSFSAPRICRMDTSTCPLTETFGTLDLALLLFNYLSWSTLVALSNTNRRFRCTTHYYMQGQAIYFLTPFLLDREKKVVIRRFFLLLEEVNGCVVGAIPRCIMADPCNRQLCQRHPPNQLDILLPKASSEHLERFLKGTAGYTSSVKWSPMFPYHQTTSQYIRLYNTVSAYPSPSPIANI